MELDILVLSATDLELKGVANALEIPLPGQGELSCGLKGAKKIGLLVTGIGMVNTAYQLGKVFQGNRIAWAIQCGIAGSFSGGPELETAVEVQRECFADLGAESPAGFLDLQALGFASFTLEGKLYYNCIDNSSAGKSGLPLVKGITVNRVHGLGETILEAEHIWQPEVESMEGAAFLQVCLQEGIPSTQVRGISNVVEVRNRANWKLPGAIRAYTTAVLEMIENER